VANAERRLSTPGFDRGAEFAAYSGLKTALRM
jgi:hypothetical protein